MGRIDARLTRGCAACVSRRRAAAFDSVTIFIRRIVIGMRGKCAVGPARCRVLLVASDAAKSGVKITTTTSEREDRRDLFRLRREHSGGCKRSFSHTAPRAIKRVAYAALREGARAIVNQSRSAYDGNLRFGVKFSP